MSYEITFKPTEEAMKKYKPWTKDGEKRESFLKYYKRELLSYCLKPHTTLNTITITKDIENIVNSIAWTVDNDTMYDAYERWKNDENNELYYCGWKFSRPCQFDKDKVIENNVDELTLFADVIPTTDFFENEEKFYDKVNRINNIIDELVEILTEIKIHQIIEELRDFEVKYDENDIIQSEAEGNLGLTNNTDDSTEPENCVGGILKE